MWNESIVLNLLNDLPKVINEANMERIQGLIDYDKFITCYDLGHDLCGKYAPFCEGCDKNHIYPCAYAYLKMIQKEGSDIRIEGENVQPTGDPEFRGDGIRVARAKRPAKKTAK
ncbi:MAG: hypothetical protein LUD47_04865 [Clostridia bacterium]|nr:hypothetical protein [Clostridia bacterium]